VPEGGEGEFSDLLFKDVHAGKAFVVNTERRGAKRATLTYRTLAHVENEGRMLSHVAVRLQTGRFHQIRVQFASRQMPLVGDGKYGSRVKAPSVALFATSLTFPHPDNGRDMTFCAPVPSNFPWSLFGKTGYEIERKFLVAYPDVSQIEGITGCRKSAIVQTYLQSPQGETHRVRRIVSDGKISHVETRKKRISMLRAVEDEREITEGEYDALLPKKEEGSMPIRKTRYAFPCGAHVVELDVYPFWQDRAIVEVELKSEGECVSLPPFLRVLKEVTDDKRYKNVNLAKVVPFDDIST
jgi:CYTH domain-containing protein